MNGISYHPSGEYIIVATDHVAPHLYRTGVPVGHCFVPTSQESFHSQPLTAVQFSTDGSMYVSCSADGDIKLWDTATNSLVQSFCGAHTGNLIHSICVSKDGRSLLSCGADSLTKLWDVKGGVQSGEMKGATRRTAGANSCWDHTEQVIFAHDEASLSIIGWDSRTFEKLIKKKTDHKQTVRHISTSPTERCLMTCSDDFRGRFWTF